MAQIRRSRYKDTNLGMESSKLRTELEITKQEISEIAGVEQVEYHQKQYRSSFLIKIRAFSALFTSSIFGFLKLITDMLQIENNDSVIECMLIGFLFGLIVTYLITMPRSYLYYDLSIDNDIVCGENILRRRSLYKGLERWHESFKHIPHCQRLVNEILNYNRAVGNLTRHLNFVDRLKNAGNTVNIENRDQIINAFREMRRDLIRALKTERILRENPDFDSTSLALNLVPSYEASEIQHQAKEQIGLINEVLGIDIKVQEEMKNIYKQLTLTFCVEIDTLPDTRWRSGGSAANRDGTQIRLVV